jgi:metallophosphoesterase superfamily enzyme
MGHEHPAVVLEDGIASSARCPCFLLADRLMILPAFSAWSAGSIVGRQPFLSPIAQKAHFKQAIAVVGHRLLPIAIAVAG